MSSFPALASILGPLLALAMGAALQGGGTCTYGATVEIVRQRRAYRARSLFEASLWAAVLLMILAQFDAASRLPPTHDIAAATFLGAATLGLGAYLNRACPLGTIVHIGKGHAEYFASPVGFFLGCALFWSIAGAAQPMTTQSLGVMGAPPAVVAALAALALLVRTGLAFESERRHSGVRQAISAVRAPRPLTIIAGLLSVALLLLVGDWTYTSILAELSSGMSPAFRERTILGAALFAGSILAGLGAGKFQLAWPKARDVVQRFGGGLLMGWGAMTIPSGHDAIVFLHIPLLRPFAFLALAIVVLTMAGAVYVEDRIAQRTA